ncbi:MAG: hypothetical protein SVR94_17935 [Pseudomonadota bacterium]|nr:hypothetical protein [Pseudomonadota bacterium]
MFLGVERTGKLVPQSEEADKYRYEKANQTINLTHLNRDTLILNRRKIIENFEYLIKKQTLYLLKHLKENNQCDMYSVAFFGIFEWIENQSKDDQEYTFTSWYIWKNIKEKLFKIICPGNHEIEQLLTHAFDLYIASGIQDE